MSRSIISDVRIIAHLCPFLFSGPISCFVIRLRSHSWRVDRRLVIHRLLGAGSSSAGNSIDGRIRGIPRRHGLVNWSKKLMIMVRVKGRFLWGRLFYWWGGWLVGILEVLVG